MFLLGVPKCYEEIQSRVRGEKVGKISREGVLNRDTFLFFSHQEEREGHAGLWGKRLADKEVAIKIEVLHVPQEQLGGQYSRRSVSSRRL